MIRYTGQLKDIKPATIKRTKKGKAIYMCTDILTFDIETSNLYRDKSGHVFRYEPGKSAEYWKSNDAPVSGYRFDAYLRIARLTVEKLRK